MAHLSRRRDREKRDLQFELAVLEIKAMRERQRKERGYREVKEGISMFEENLIRLGVGISSPESGRDMAVGMSEDTRAFESRLRNAYRSDELQKEVTEFEQELRRRVANVRSARQEQIRRRGENRT